jgi:ribonuclease VapC
MIVVDTSALMAIILGEAEAEACIDALTRAKGRLISAGTVTEALIASAGRDNLPQMMRIIDSPKLEIVSLTAAAARQMGQIYLRWGKGHHPAGLNFGDCFAYQLASERDLPLLFVGQDFARTDIRSALKATGS